MPPLELHVPEKSVLSECRPFLHLATSCVPRRGLVTAIEELPEPAVLVAGRVLAHSDHGAVTAGAERRQPLRQTVAARAGVTEVSVVGELAVLAQGHVTVVDRLRGGGPSSGSPRHRWKRGGRRWR